MEPQPLDHTGQLRSEADELASALHYSHEAMATIFDIYADHEDPGYVRQAAQAAFEEVDRLEQDMSRFIPNSDISRLNRARAGESVELGIDVWQCLRDAKDVYDWTGGAFDITIGQLFRCWIGEDRRLLSPTMQQLSDAVARTGMDKLAIDAEMYSARVTTEGLWLDLGGIGKGYAVDRMAAILHEWDIPRAFLLGGGSSVLAMEPPRGEVGWPVTFSHPLDLSRTLVKMHLRNRAVAGSGQQRHIHIIDPRQGRPVAGKVASWSSTPLAVHADALSTAFLIMDSGRIRQFCEAHPDMGAMYIPQTDDPAERTAPVRCGCWPNAEFAGS